MYCTVVYEGKGCLVHFNAVKCSGKSFSQTWKNWIISHKPFLLNQSFTPKACKLRQKQTSDETVKHVTLHLHLILFTNFFQMIYYFTLKIYLKTAENCNRKGILRQNSVCPKPRIYPPSEIQLEQRSTPSWNFPCLIVA